MESHPSEKKSLHFIQVKRQRAWVLLACLLTFVAIIYGITMVKIAQNKQENPAHATSP